MRKKEIRMKLPRPSEEEQQAIINQHKHHLIEQRKGTVRTPIGIIEDEDFYCHTCKEWLGLLSKLKFKSKPHEIGRKAVWVDGQPDDLDVLAKTYGLSEKGKALLKLQKEDPQRLKLIMEMWKEDDFLRDLKKLMKKYGISKDKVAELLNNI